MPPRRARSNGKKKTKNALATRLPAHGNRKTEHGGGNKTLSPVRGEWEQGGKGKVTSERTAPVMAADIDDG